MVFKFKLFGKTHTAEEVGVFDLRMGRSLVKQVVAGSGCITESTGFTIPYEYMSIMFDEFLVQVTVDETSVIIYADEEGFVTFDEFKKLNPEIEACD